MNKYTQDVQIKTGYVSHTSFLFIFVIISSLFLIACNKTVLPIQINGKTMGTTYHITIIPESNDILDVDFLQNGIDKELQLINQLMSTYIADSELSNFNTSRSTDWFQLSPETFKVIEYSLSLSEQTNSLFDVTVSPLINLWGFGEQGLTDFPSDKAIKDAQENIGWQHLVLDADNQKIKKKKSELTINLSAIAKGYGVDHIAQWLEQQQVNHYLVEIGGEIKVKGTNKDGQLWKIGVEKPSFLQSNTQTIISIDDKAVATSGDYRNFFEKEGIRYSHTIDPTTGKPVIHNLASLTVIADSAMEADGLATAFMVMGEDQALKMAEEYNIPLYILLYQEGTFTASYSPSFTPYLNDK